MLPNLINLGTEKWYVNADNAMLDIDIPELVWIGGIGFKSSYDSTLTDKKLAYISVYEEGSWLWIQPIDKSGHSMIIQN